MEDDDDEVLAWKALEEHDDAHHHPHSHHHHHHHHHVVGHVHGGGLSTGTDDDVEDFAELAYAHHARMTAAAVTQPPHSLLQLQQEDQHDDHDSQQLSHHDGHDHHQQQLSQQNQNGQRFKRKNFSKQLQLICLQRYAQSAKAHGKLPDKTACQLLLHQSYLQFLKDGGAPDEPRLSHQEFLKLIRNRRREMYVRTQKLKFPHSNSSSSSSSTAKATNSNTAASGGNAEAAGETQPLSAAKRKLQEEHARIYELIEIIDQAREQSGLVSDHQSQNQNQQTTRPVQRNGKRRLSAKSSSPQQAIALGRQHQHHSQQLAAGDVNDQINAIFRIQQETLEVQREIAERLKVIRLHRSLRQLDPMEPSSASV